MGAGKSKPDAPKGRKSTKSNSGPPPPLPESSTAQKTVDPRLPFDTYRQVFNLRNSWKTITRGQPGVAHDNLIFFFNKYPQHKELFATLKHLDKEEDMKADDAFEIQALAIFGVFDETMANIENVDTALVVLKKAGQCHTKVQGFTPAFYKDMEEGFMRTMKQTLGDRLTDANEQSLEKFYRFVTQKMTEYYNASKSR